MTLRFAICPGCKVSITLPDDYVNFGPWLSAHAKTCPGEKTPKLVARVRRRKKGDKAVNVRPDPELQTDEFLKEAGAEAGKRLIAAVIDMFFGGRVRR